MAVDGGFEQTDAAHLGACLDVCATLDLQALDDGDGGAGGCFDFVEVFAHGSFFCLCGCAAPLRLITAALGGGAAGVWARVSEGGVRRWRVRGFSRSC